MVATLLFQVALLTDFCASVPTYESEHWAAPDVCHEVWDTETYASGTFAVEGVHLMPFTRDVVEPKRHPDMARVMTEMCDVAATVAGGSEVRVLVNGNEYVCNDSHKVVR